jgi:hypothetical protein
MIYTWYLIGIRYLQFLKCQRINNTNRKRDNMCMASLLQQQKKLS